MRRWQLIALLVLGSLVLSLAFAPSLAGEWIWDDHTLIEHNLSIHSLHDWQHWWTHDFWNVSAETLQHGSRLVYWRPLITASYAIDWQLGDGGPAWFHVMNLVWEALVTALSLLALRRWIGSLGPAIAVAVLLAVHPTRVESVAWISGRTDILCMVFVLVAAAGMARRLRGKRGGLAIEIAGTLLAYTCKEQAIVLPVFAALEAWVARDRPPLDWPVLKAVAIAALPQAVVTIIYLVLRGWLLPLGHAVDALDPVTHVELVVESIGRFNALAIAPHDMSAQRGLQHVLAGATQVNWGYIAIGVASVAAMVSIVVATRKRMPSVAVGVIVYFATLLPTTNIRNTDMLTLIAERFLYMPLIGLAFALGSVLARADAIWRRRAYFLVGAVSLAFTMMSLARSVDWIEENQFWEHELELQPDSVPSRLILVERYLRQNQFPKALDMLVGLASSKYDRPPQTEVLIAYLSSSIGSHITPDRDVTTLRAYDAFLLALTEPERKTATLDVPRQKLAVDMTRKHYTSGLTMLPNLLVLRANIASRLGDDATATHLAMQAGHMCELCITIRGPELEVLAGAQQYDAAATLIAGLRGKVDDAQLDVAAKDVATAKAAHVKSAASAGVEKLRWRAKELAAVSLWGRAYAAIADRIADAAEIPEFAELAFKAGDVATAKRLLGANAEAQIATWSASLGLEP